MHVRWLRNGSYAYGAGLFILLEVVSIPNI